MKNDVPIEELDNVHDEGCDGYHCTCRLKRMKKASVTELIPDFEVTVELEDENTKS